MDQSGTVAQGLRACDMAPDQMKILRMPSKIFTVKARIHHGNILAFPKSIFSGDFGVLEQDIARILEGIFAIRFKSVYLDALAEHERI